MANPDAYIREIESIDEALKRLNTRVKELKAKKQLSRERLYRWMESHHTEEYKGYSARKLAPRPKSVRKRAKEKKADAMRLFSEVGITDPEEFWDALQATQKPPPKEVAEEC